MQDVPKNNKNKRIENPSKDIDEMPDMDESADVDVKYDGKHIIGAVGVGTRRRKSAFIERMNRMNNMTEEEVRRKRAVREDAEDWAAFSS